jgi:hypothetical protein
MPQPNNKDYATRKAERAHNEKEHAPMPWWWLRQRDPIARFTAYLVLFTFCLVFVGILQWVSIRGQLHEMKAQRLLTMAQISANLKQERTIITPYGEGEKPISQGEIIRGWHITPSWTNVGGSDARGFVGWFEVIPYNFMPPRPPNGGDCPVPVEPKSPRPEYVIQPHAGMLQVAQKLALEDVIRAKNGKGYILVVGHIEFRDIFPDTPIHHRNWCELLIPDDPARNIWSDIMLSERAD